MPSLRVPRRWRALAALLPAVLALHALVLGLLPLGVGSGWQADAPPRSLQVRQWSVAPPAAASPAPGPLPAVAAAPAPRPLPSEPPPVHPPAHPPVLQPAPLPVREPQAPAAPAASAVEAPAAEALPAVAALAASAPAGDVAPAVFAAATEGPASAASATAATAATAADAGPRPPPVYATRFPPPAVLSYDLRRGALGGSGEIRWQPAAGRYTMELQGSAFGLSVLNWHSEGGVDAAGLAPERFLDQRRGGRSNAANFQRAAGKITYSGPGVEYPLLPGAQDRLSWTVQLAAIVAAEPARFTAGEAIAMFVTGARGDGDVWTFEVGGRERLDLPAGSVPDALKLRRQPRRPYDTLVEVWLDPARAWLPVRMRWIVVQTDETTEFRLTGSELR